MSSFKDYYKSLLDKHGIAVEPQTSIYAEMLDAMAKDRNISANAKLGFDKYYENISRQLVQQQLSGVDNGRYHDFNGLNKVNLYMTNSSDGGEYDPSIPNAVGINFNDRTWPFATTLFHENQHRKDYLRKGKDGFPENWYYDTGDNPSIRSFAKKSIDGIYDKYKDKYTLPNDFKTRPWVHLGALNEALPVGQNIFDLDIGKELAQKIAKDTNMDETEVRRSFYQMWRPTNGTYMSTTPEDEQPSLLRELGKRLKQKLKY